MPQQQQRNHREERQFAIQIGARIQLLRLEQGLSLRNVAELGGCSVSTLASIEHGLAAMTVSTLNAIAKALNVQPFDLLNYDPSNSDVGFLLETMREHPECISTINAKLAALT